MDHIDDLQYKEIQALVQTLNHHLLTLASSLKGRLSPTEADALANLFQVQMNLQTLLDERTLESARDAVSQKSEAEEASGAGNRNADRIVYAQAMQYARDLVKALQQKKEHQQRLELTSQQLIRAEKLATVGQVAAAVSHELGNIITPLLMYAKLIYKETAGNEQSEVAEFATQITKIANRASDMLRQLVDAARSERAMMIPVDLTFVIQNALALLSHQTRRQGINVHHNYVDGLPLVLGRPDQLEQVVLNISLNAFDAMPNGGDFTITVEPGNGLDDQARQTDFLMIRLSDTGGGIPPEDIGLLFEPFYTTKERGAGSGLGLFVSHLIVDQHGGAIEVESNLGQGTTFTLKLPTATKGEGD